MARKLRVQFPKACYHVINRGSQRQRIFGETSDYTLFIEKLTTALEEFRVGLRCYCIMPNHFHLYLQTEQANLSRFMQSFLVAFTMTFNRRKGSSGHLFQGRYKAYLVEDEAYRSVLSRYIHMNPVDTLSLRDIDLKRKKKILENYEWSSYCYYAGKKPCPKWLKIADVLQSFGDTTDKGIRNYKAYVASGLTKGIEDPFDRAEAQFILGSDSFIDRIRRKYLLKPQTGEQDQPQLRYLRGGFEISEIVTAVSEIYGVKESVLLKARSRAGGARRFLAFCLSRYCRSRYSLSYLASIMGIGTSALSRFKSEVQTAMKSGEFQDEFSKIEKKLSQ